MELLTQIILPALTLICGGGWWYTAKQTRQQAQADAMQHFQTVYQKLIEDIKKDRDDIRTSRDMLQDEIRKMKSQLTMLESNVERNNKVIVRLAGLACAKAGTCPDCILIDISQI